MATSPSRVRVASLCSPVEAAMVRSLLEAHEVAVVISGEHHAAMLGGLAGPMLQLDVIVDVEDAEQATELIQQWRGETGEPDAPDEPDEPRDWSLELRRRTGITLLLACVITFGFGHLYARAPGRALLCAAIEGVGLYRVAREPAVGAGLIVLAVLLDLVGALRLVRRDLRERRLPDAHARH